MPLRKAFNADVCKNIQKFRDFRYNTGFSDKDFDLKLKFKLKSNMKRKY